MTSQTPRQHLMTKFDASQPQHGSLQRVKSSPDSTSSARKEKCDICGRSQTYAFGAPLQYCSGCKLRFHLDCHVPPIPANTKGSWRCSRCAKQELISLRQSLQSPRMDISELGGDHQPGASSISRAHYSDDSQRIMMKALKRLTEQAKGDEELAALLTKAQDHAEKHTLNQDEHDRFVSLIDRTKEVIRSEQLETLTRNVSPPQHAFKLPSNGANGQNKTRTNLTSRRTDRDENQGIDSSSIYPPGAEPRHPCHGCLKLDLDIIGHQLRIVCRNSTSSRLATEEHKQPELVVLESPCSRRRSSHKWDICNKFASLSDNEKARPNNSSQSGRPKKRRRIGSVIDLIDEGNGDSNELDGLTAKTSVTSKSQHVSSSDVPSKVRATNEVYIQASAVEDRRSSTPGPNRRLEELATQVKKLRQENLDLHRRLENMEASRNDMRLENEQTTSLLSEDRKKLEENCKKIKQQGSKALSEKMRVIEELKESLKNLERTDIRDAQEEIERLNTSLHEKTTALQKEIFEGKKEIVDLKRHRVLNLKEISRLQNSLPPHAPTPSAVTSIDGEESAKSETVKRLEKSLAKLTEDREKERAIIKALEKVHSEQSKRFKGMEAEMNQHQAQVKHLQDEREELRAAHHVEAESATEPDSEKIAAQLYQSRMEVFAVKQENRRLQESLENRSREVMAYQPVMLEEIESCRSLDRNSKMKEIQARRALEKKHDRGSVMFTMQDRKRRGDPLHETKISREQAFLFRRVSRPRYSPGQTNGSSVRRKSRASKQVVPQCHDSKSESDFHGSDASPNTSVSSGSEDGSEGHQERRKDDEKESQSEDETDEYSTHSGSEETPEINGRKRPRKDPDCWDSGSESEDHDIHSPDWAMKKSPGNQRIQRRFEKEFCVPRKPIPVLVNRKLAFRTGEKNAKGQVPRTAKSFEVGRRIPGELFR